MRLWMISIVGLVLAATGTAQAALFPLAPQQLELCRLHDNYTGGTAAYDRAQYSMNSIQRASAPPRPKIEDYAIRFAKDIGPSGDFKDWTGIISFIANAADRTVALNIEFKCPPNPANGRPGDFGSVRNVSGPILTPWQKYLAANGYRGIPLDSQIAQGLAKIPNDDQAHYVRFSGHLLYLPSVAGAHAMPTYARPDAEPSPFDIGGMMFVFRVTSLAIFR